MDAAREKPLQPEDFGIGRLFWIVRDAIVVGDAATGQIVLWSPSAEEMFGYTAAEVIGRSIELLVPEHLRETHRMGLERYHRTGHGQLIDRRTPVELPAVRKSGEECWIELSLNPVEEADSGGRYVLAVIRDTTTRHQAEAERRERARAEALAAERTAILDQIAEGVIIADADGRISFVNTAARRIHGTGELNVAIEAYVTAYRPRTIDGQPYPPEDLPLTRAVHKGETVLNARWRIGRPDGTEIVAEGSATPVLAPDGGRLGSVLVMRDVSAQAALEREKDDFLAAVSHDLKSPVAAVQGTVQLLRAEATQTGGIAPERLHARLDRIEHANTRMNGMLDQLLDLARLSLDRPLELDLRPTDLVALTRRVIDEHQSTTARHRLSLETSEADLIGNWDAQRLERVVNNLLENAIKYSPAGGSVILRLRRNRDAPNAEAVLQVADQGVGIKAEDLPNVFERFWRGANVRGTIPGTGIGLSAVHQIVQRMGGTIEVESRAGSGSTFSVRLPVLQSAA